jgi:hypothetical protein
MAKHRAVSTGSYGLKEEIHYLYYASLVSAENVRNARAIQRSDVVVGVQAGVCIKRLPPGG